MRSPRRDLKHIKHGDRREQELGALGNLLEQRKERIQTVNADRVQVTLGRRLEGPVVVKQNGGDGRSEVDLGRLGVIQGRPAS